MTTNPYESPENAANLPRQRSQLRKFPLQLLTIIGIIGLLGACLIPNLRRCAREAARRMQCSNNLKQIGLALQNYHDDHHSLPPAYIADSNGKPIHSWRVLILPYLERKALYDKYSFDEPWDGPNNSKLHDEIVHVFCCPSRPGQQTKTQTSYVAVVGASTAWPDDKAISLADIKDGTSNTVVVVEMEKSGIHWMEPRDLNFDQIPMAVNPQNGRGISSDHPGVAMAVFLDGHTYALTKDTPSETVRRLLTIADGEQAGDY
jgi:type II secretory pathway pseudopilin PulG